MPEKNKSEFLRGLRESRERLETLRVLWPLAFPKKSHLVRPLAVDVQQIAEKAGWSRSFAQGVLVGWKMRYAYCAAVLHYDRRCNLNGDEVAESTVDEDARTMARKRLAAMEARRLKMNDQLLQKPAGASINHPNSLPRVAGRESSAN